MKKLLIFFFLISSLAQAQTPPANYTAINQCYQWLAGQFKALTAPAGITPALTTGQWPIAGALFVDTSGGVKGLYVYYDGTWNLAGGAASNIYNTNGVLTANRILSGGSSYDLFFDSLQTFVVTSRVFNSQSGYLSINHGNFNLYMNDADASQLTALQLGADGGVFRWTDGAIDHIIRVDGNGIGLTADPSATVSDSAYTRDASGTLVYSPIGGGGTSSNVNVGAGFRLALPNTNNIKTLRAGANVTLDSLTTNEIGISAVGDTTVANVLAYGAIPNDGLSDDVAFRAAVATGKPVYVPPVGRFFLNDTLFIPAKGEIFGSGANSLLYTTEDSVNILHLTDSAYVHDLTFQGTGISTVPAGVFTLQNGIYYGGSGNRIENCTFYDFAGSGVYSWALTTIFGNDVQNNIFNRCTIGIFLLVNSEYGTYHSNKAYYCAVGMLERKSGNNKWLNNTLEYNTGPGFRLVDDNSANGGHGQFVGNTANHNGTYGIEVQSAEHGYLFTNNQLWLNATGLAIGSVDTARYAIFSDNVVAGGTITTTKARGCVFTGGSWGTTTVTVSGTTGIEYCHIGNSIYATVGCGTSSGMTNPMTAANSLIIGGVGGAPTELVAGADGTYLKYTTAGGVAWATLSGGGDVSKVGTPVNNQVGVWTGSGTLEGDPNFTWDASTLAVTGATTVSTSLRTPLVVGGTAAGDALTLQSTTGTGTTTGNALVLKGGTNGGTTLATYLNNGDYGQGTAPSSGTRYFMVTAGNTSSTNAAIWRNPNGNNLLVVNSAGDVSLGNQGTTTSINKLYNKTFAGGNTVPTAILHLGAGTASAQTAPLKFTSGTNMTTPESGAVEYDGTHFYGTNSTPTRMQLENRRNKTTATDANTTITDTEGFIVLPVVTADRTLTLPSASVAGLEMVIWNQNNSGTFSWSFASTVFDATSATITTLTNQSFYRLISDGTRWVKTN